MKIIIGIYLIVIIICILEAYFCTITIDEADQRNWENGSKATAFLYKDEDEDEKSECCGANYIGETDLCSECKEHTGRKI